ncbi:C45 family peptidase [Actibacterium sp. MT2.3-13A]|uniref:C45 family autoproteolytic acyltransferase/hydolase n=1 Tax=Actibacterium sp. MT2.3-13A TaxID=2828332 RepID=UPI001BA65CD9|nr:C45 family peptidase [Actibacterium sp. MT2.3-13A]
MTGPVAEPGAALRLNGSPYERGLGQVAGAPSEEVREALVTRLDAARKAGALGAEAQRYLDAQRRFAARACPDAMAELSGIADGFGIAEDDLFAHLHLGILTDISRVSRGDHDGCSAWAVSDGPDGPLVVKNRDFSGRHTGIQRVFRHDGPDLEQGPLLCLGSLGSPGAYSSGMNAAGLAVADTQVGVRRHGTGWLRYFLMTEILARAATVAAALALIRSVPHAGGGTLLLADRAGGAAAVELGCGSVAIEQAELVCRTNHFTTTALAPETLTDPGSLIDGSSARRRAVLDRDLPGQSWDAASAASLMGGHGGGAPICQHGEGAEAHTIASAVYCCRAGLMYACLDTPCSGAWLRIPLAA